MRIHHTIALMSFLGVAGLLYPLVDLLAKPDPAEAARTALGAGDYPKAIALYTDILQSERLDPATLATVYQERGVARHKSGSAIQAIADYTNAIWLGTLSEPQLARTLLDRGIAYVEVGELIRARHDFDNAIAKAPQLADAYFGRATVVRLLGRPADSVADYTQALRLGHAAPELVYFGRGLAEEALGASDRAIADYLQAARNAPNFEPVKAKLAKLAVPFPSAEEIAAVALDRARQPLERPKDPAASLALADAGEILTMAGTPPAEATGSLDPLAPQGAAAGPPVVLSSAKLRPPREALLAEQAVSDNAHAGAPEPADPGQGAPPQAAAPDPAADAAAPTGALPPAPAAPPSQAPPVPEPQAAPAPQADAAPAAAAAPNAPPAAPAKGAFSLQLGAYIDRASADRGAGAFAARFPAVASAHPTIIEEAQIVGRGTVYRLRIGAFANEAESRAACSALKSKDQACLVVFPPKLPR